MKKTINVLLIIAVLYIIMSAVFSFVYALFPSIAWDIATHRNGLAIVEISPSNGWMLNPFTNYGDDWIQLY